MDADALRSKGAHPANVRPAALPGYAIRIGNRATLVREPGSSAYGVLMDLPRRGRGPGPWAMWVLDGPPPPRDRCLVLRPRAGGVSSGARRGRRAKWR